MSLAAEEWTDVDFLLGVVDLGRTGEVIQATYGRGYELEQEKAEAATRIARVVNDAAWRTTSRRPARAPGATARPTCGATSCSARRRCRWPCRRAR